MKRADFNLEINEIKITEIIEGITERSKELKDKTIFRKIFSLIDLTSLDVSDTDEKIGKLVDKVNSLSQKFPELPNIAAICVYPVFVPLLKTKLNNENVKIASVGACFPSSQTFLDVKISEVRKIVKEGADEVDVVMSVGKFLSGNYVDVFKEIQELKKAAGEAHLKVILEVSALNTFDNIKLASLISLEAGADFIKTSTGKNGEGANPEAVYIMCQAIKEHFLKTKRVAGIKPAGGISDATTAIQYYLIVNEVLGNDWLNPSRFRIGASRLANNLLGEKYF